MSRYHSLDITAASILINEITQKSVAQVFFEDVFPMVKTIFLNDDLNLFDYLQFSLSQVIDYLDIHTEILISSEIDVKHDLKSENRVGITDWDDLYKIYYVYVRNR